MTVGRKRTVRVIKQGGWGLRMTIVRSSLYDAGVHAWTTESGNRKGKKGRGERSSFRHRFGWMGIRRRRVMVMEVVVGMGRVRGIIGTGRHDDLPLQTLGRVSPGREGGEVHRLPRPAEGGGGNNIPFFEVVRDLAVVLDVVFCEEGGV